MSTEDPAARARRRRREAARERARRRRLVALGCLVAVLLAATGLAVALGGDDGGTPASAGASSGGGEGTQTGAAAAPPRTPPPADATLDVAAVGDIVMGSDAFGLPPDGGASFFDPVEDLLVGDVVLGNLEGTLATGGSSKCGGSSSGNCFAFRTPPSYGRYFEEAGFTVLNLANNHSYDFGATGQRQTVATLKRIGMPYTGLPGQYATLKPNELTVAVLGFAPYDWANELTDIPAAKRLVASAATKADIVIVTMHAGAEGTSATRVRPGTEYYLGENRGDVTAFSKAVIDSGADLVIGHGPHVLRGMQVYKGRLIAYSMGNFAGYKVFALGGASSTSGVLQVTLASDGRLVSGRFRPTQLVGSGTPAPGGSGIATVQQLSRLDFGARAPRISSDGAIRPRAGG